MLAKNAAPKPQGAPFKQIQNNKLRIATVSLSRHLNLKCG